MGVVVRAVVVTSWLVAMGCGRIGFDERIGGNVSGDSIGEGDSDAIVDLGPLTASCLGLEATCGLAGNASCCGSPLVSGGMTYRGYDVGTDNAFVDMTNPAMVNDFRLDRYEVTVGRFRKFVNAGMGAQPSAPPAGAGARTLGGVANRGGWDATWNTNLTADTAALVAAVKCDAQRQTWTDVPGANEGMPMNCVTWYEAMAFCVWDGGYLPTEAEWSYAAAGGSEQRAYPWSVPPSSLALDCSYANLLYYTNYCVGSPSFGLVDRAGNRSPKGDGRWGHGDLVGNLSEWTLDTYATTYPNPCDNCANLNGTTRVVRGGGFGNSNQMVRVAFRGSGSAPTSRGIASGWRCARPL